MNSFGRCPRQSATIVMLLVSADATTDFIGRKATLTDLPACGTLRPANQLFPSRDQHRPPAPRWALSTSHPINQGHHTAPARSLYVWHQTAWQRVRDVCGEGRTSREKSVCLRSRCGSMWVSPSTKGRQRSSHFDVWPAQTEGDRTVSSLAT
jgi:hypothetical protein